MSTNTYHFIREGEKPLPILKEVLDYHRSDQTTQPDHPIVKAKGFELVAIPENQSWSTFKDNFLANTAKPNTVYIAILKMGTKKIQIDEMQMTGKCNTNENIAKGARKWDTKYVVYVNGKEIQLFDGKTEAMQFAKQYAIDNDTEVNVELEKRLNGSASRVADIKPMKKHVKKIEEVVSNQFLFFGKGE